MEGGVLITVLITVLIHLLEREVAIFGILTLTIANMIFGICVGLAVMAYLNMMYNSISPHLYPDLTMGENEPRLLPLWKESTLMNIHFHLSPYQGWNTRHFANASEILHLGTWTDLPFDWNEGNERTMELELNAGNASQASLESRIQFWNRIRQNSSVYLHVHVAHENMSPDPLNPKKNGQPFDESHVIHQAVCLTTILPRLNHKNATNLLKGIIPDTWLSNNKTLLNTKHNHDPLHQSYIGEDLAFTATMVSFWKPEIAIRMVTDFSAYPLQRIPSLVHPSLRFRKRNDQFYYLPVMYVDEMALTDDKLLPMNRTTNVLPLKLVYAPLSFQRWQSYLLVEQSLKQNTEMGMSATDLNQIRHTIVNVHPWLLLLTMIVTILHLGLDLMAFKTDISFWNEKRNLVGISMRSMVISILGQSIMILYLIEQDTIIFVIISTFFTLTVDCWKLIKTTKPSFSLAQGLSFPGLSGNDDKLNTTTIHAQKTTSVYDQMAMQYLSHVLMPFIIGYLAYSLLYNDYTSWYSFALSAGTGIFYTFGFIMMTPQLFINYKLKSVAHLSWNALVYRAVNTFIDDLFAFVIHMPMMHRMSCFRDDLIFFIYLYQRWIYPVDQARLDNEVKEEEEEKKGPVEKKIQ